jgi:hypothetical protein
MNVTFFVNFDFLDRRSPDRPGQGKALARSRKRPGYLAFTRRFVHVAARKTIAMELTRQRATILQTVGDFGEIERYEGLMPNKHVLIYDEKDLRDLVREGLIEWRTIEYP